MRTLVYCAPADDLVVFVGGDAVSLSNDEWAEYVHFVERSIPPRQAPNALHRFLVFGDVGPDAKQRAALVAVMSSARTRTAVFSLNVIARNLITAFGWVGVPTRGFAPTNATDAGSYLELAPARLRAAVAVAVTLAPQVGGARSLAATSGSMGLLTR
jgi:hypothetical protein